MRRLDVAIIGGSLAGAACARALSRQGVDAVAFERAMPPRERVCGGFLSPGAVVCLEKLNLLESAREAGAKEVREARIHIDRREIRFDLPRPGLGISRRTLDALVAHGAPVERGAVRSVTPQNGEFLLDVDGVSIQARVVIDAAGKTSRFTKHKAESEFGVQFYEDGMAAAGELAFWFSQDYYGGAVEVDGGRTNCSFLVRKGKFGTDTNFAATVFRLTDNCGREIGVCPEFPPLVTGPLAYEAEPSPWIAIGDAAGMIDPFCGEGMRHALDTALTAADAVGRGFRNGQAFAEMKRRYEDERRRRWSSKRQLASVMRAAARRPNLAGLLPARASGWLMKGLIERLWA